MTHNNTKTMRNAYEQFNNSSIFDLDQCYYNFSRAKAQAYDYCIELFNRYNGVKFRITGYNSMIFSVGFIGEINGKKAFFYITPHHDRYIYIEELEK